MEGDLDGRQGKEQKEVEERDRPGGSDSFRVSADPLEVVNVIQRSDSWAEEVEREVEKRTKANGEDRFEVEDREQWTVDRRVPSKWAENLEREVRGSAERVGRSRQQRKTARMDGQRKVADRLEDEHECGSEKVKRVHHWFGRSSGEETDSSDPEGWNTMDREGKNEEKRRRARERGEKMKTEVTMKARRMAGVGPITTEEIDQQWTKTKDYNKAKIWAVKAHLAVYYRYNQEELDRLEILETKRNIKDEIIYIAVTNESDIRDIYSRKAECRRDDTVVKSYIPPQYWERFVALNRVCAEKRALDGKLKTQIRFGTKDLIILTKEKGSQDPYYMENLDDFTDGRTLLKVDLGLKWKFQEDRPPRRRVGSGNPAGGTDCTQHTVDWNAGTDNQTTESGRHDQ